MRRYLRYTFSILTMLIVLVGCEPKDNSIYNFVVSSHNICAPHHENDTTIEYDIVYGEFSTDLSSTTVTVTTDAMWVKSIDTSTLGAIVIRLEENSTESERTATIKLSAPNTASECITLTQLSTPPYPAAHTAIHFFFGTSLSYHFKNNLKDSGLAIREDALGDSGRYLFFMQRNRNNGYIGEIRFCSTNNIAVEHRIADITIEEGKPIDEFISATLKQMAEIAPAQSYGVIMAGHGSGWVTREMLSDDAIEFSAIPYTNIWTPAAGAEATRTFGENNVQANIAEIATGIKNSGVTFDYILFDACFMSNIEALYDLRNSANYIVASPCEIMANGFPYHRALSHLYADRDTRDKLTAVAEAYYTYYRDEYTSPNRSGSIAVIDCRELEALADATRSVLQSATTDYDKSALQTYEGQNPHTFYDFGGWCRAIATDAAALSAFEAQLERTIIARYTLPSFYSALGSFGNYPIDIDSYTGVTTSAPCNSYAGAWMETSWYKRVME